MLSTETLDVRDREVAADEGVSFQVTPDGDLASAAKASARAASGAGELCRWVAEAPEACACSLAWRRLVRRLLPGLLALRVVAASSAPPPWSDALDFGRCISGGSSMTTLLVFLTVGA